MSEIKESDWKLLRKLKTVALERFCQSVLKEVEDTCLQSSKTCHERYLHIFALLRDRDEKVARAFNDLRRSTALARLINMKALGLLTDQGFAGFSEETRSRVSGILAAEPLGGNGAREAGQTRS